MRSRRRAGGVSLACATLTFTALTFTALTWRPAAAQMISDGASGRRFTDAESRLGGPAGGPVDDAVGVTLAPGVVWTPRAFIEGGYDSNPDRLFDQQGTAFLRTGVGAGVSAISQRTMANLNATGSWTGFAEDVGQDSRFSGGVSASVSHQLAPGWTLSAAGLYDHDGSKRIASDVAGASSELGYRSDVFGAFLRGRIMELSYDNAYPVIPAATPEIAPLFNTSAFNAQKDELGVGALFLPKSWISPYFEGGAARIDYTDQKLPALVNRDGDDYYGKTGVRVVLSPNLRADVGWRWNARDLDDKRVSSFDSNFFDGSVTWTPSRFFAMTASLERTIGEPTTAFGLMSDIRAYELKANYRPVNGVTMSLGVQRQLGTDLGGDYHYRSTVLNAGLAYDYTRHIQFYSGLRYEYYNVDWQDTGYTRAKALAGIRFIPDGRDMFKGGDLEGLAERLRNPRLPRDADLTISTGYSWFDLPGVKMTTIVGGPFFNQSVGQQENYDGDTGGGRIDLRLANAARYVNSEGQAVSFGLSGFYAGYSGSQRSKCYYTATTDCAYVNIVDFNPNEENNTGAFGRLDTRTKRDIDYYGVALDARLGALLGGSLKDKYLPEMDYSPFRVGVAARGLNEHTKLHATDTSVCPEVNYDEKLDTHYFGGFLGVEKEVALGGGWSANFDGTAGLYYADTMYRGRYAGYVAVISPTPGFAEERGAVDASADRGAFIGSLRLGLNRDLGWGSLGVYGQAEYLSYAPGVAYNNNDLAGGAPWGLQGSQVGTHVTSDDAMNYTGGVSLTVKLK